MDCFIDTSGWGAWVDRHDRFHSLAVQCVNDVWGRTGRLITTNWVLDELTALLISPIKLPRPQQIQLLLDIRQDPGVSIVTVDPALENEGWTLWETRLDKVWTLTDCISFCLMKSRGLLEAITGDRHFEQAGFVRLLK